MSIATRINSMENNIRNAYHGLDSIGIDTTNTNKNIENISALLDDFYDSLPKVSGTGTNISLSPTKKGRITSQINGDTFQKTYTGKNLLEDTQLKNTIEKNGITATPVYENGLLQYINFNGTATANTYFNVSRQDFGETRFNSDTGGSTEYIATSGNSNLRLTYDISYTYTYFANGRTVNNEKLYPMIRLASVSDSNYEPYVGGQPSPNPLYQQNIESGTGLQKVGVCGKNWFNPNEYTLTQKSAYNSAGTEVRWSSYVGTRDYVKVQPNTTYTWSCSTNKTLANIPCYDINKNLLSVVNSNTFTTPNNCYYIRFSWYDTNEEIPTWEQLEKGSTATTYEAFSGETYDINLGDIELNKIGDCQDYISGTPNNWVINKQIGIKVYDGSEDENWYIQLKTYRIAGFDGKTFSSLDPDNPLAYANYFVWKSGVATNFVYGAFWYILNGTQLVVQKDETPTAETLADFKTWLSTHNLKVVYQLQTPTTTPITNTELIEDLNAFYYAKSKQGQTNISVDGNLPIILDVSALKGEE